LGAALEVDDVEDEESIGGGGRGERPDRRGAVAVPVEEPVREVAVGPVEEESLGLAEEEVGEAGLGLGRAYLSSRGSSRGSKRINCCA
jgi:hypothetical protein